MRWWMRPRVTSGFEQVLARCLAAVEAGEATIDTCLAEHPAHAERLGPALRTALEVRQRLAATPDPAFVLRARQRVLDAAAQRRAPLTVVPPVERSARRRALRPVFAAAVAASVLLVASVPLAAVTSADALPGDWNYSWKLFFEEAQVALARSSEDKALERLERAEERANEIRELAERGRVEAIPEVAQAYQEQLEKARAPIYKDNASPDLVARIEQSVQRQEETIRVAVERLQGGPAVVQAATPTPSATPAPPTPPTATSATPTTEPSASAVPGGVASPSATPSPAVPTGTPAPAGAVATPAASRPAASPQQAQARDAAQSALTQAQQTRNDAAQAVARAAQTATPSPTVVVTATATATQTATRTAVPSATPVPPLTPITGPTVTPTPVQTPASASTATPVPPLTPVETPTASGTAGTRTVEPATPTAVSTPVTPRPTAVTPLPTLPPATPTPRPATTPTPVVTPAETPRATATPAPAETAAPEETPRAAATPVPPAVTPTTPGVRSGLATAAPPTPTPVPPLSRPVTLPAGRSTFLYLGMSLPVEDALVALAGKYTLVEWKPANSPVILQYRPGVSTNRPVLSTGSIVVINLTEPVTVGPGLLVQIEQ